MDDLTNKGVVKDGVSLIITTYNWPEALDIVLERVVNQSVMPNEVIVADDGSTEETKELIDLWREQFPVPVIHSWIEDEGFRASMSRNMAIKQSSYSYLIFLDGDILIRRRFVEDHLKAREKGYFLAGSRARLSKELSDRLLSKEIRREGFFTKGVGRRLVFLHCPWYHKFVKGITDHYKKVRSCHLSLWRKNIIDVDGFDESFEGWGLEDSDLIVRLMNNGVKRKNLPLIAGCSHIFHSQKENNRLAENEKYLQAAIERKQTMAVKGISKSK
ncbi:glycosyltransferase family 2 protein [Prolixibacteraceae bacterium]|nr:glycosyltransferase family 2 protein [Prolixibacteraceae bacterium]